MAIEATGGGLVHGCPPLDVRERNEDHSSDSRGERGGEHVRKPAHVRLRQEAFGPRRKENTREVHDRVDRLDGGRKRLRLGQIRLDRNDIGRAGEILRERPSVIHEPQVVTLHREMPREKTAEVSRRAGDQGARSMHPGG